MLVLALPSCAFAAGWTPAAWSFTNSWSATNAIATNPMYAVHTIDIITQGSTTNIIPAIDKSGYSFRGWMTEELADLGAINGFGEALLVYTSEYDNAHHPFDYRIEDIYSNATVFSATNVFVVDGGTNELITEISRTYSGAVVQVSMDVDTLRDYEMYMAVWERAVAISQHVFSTYQYYPQKDNSVYGNWYAKDHRKNLNYVKLWINNNFDKFLCLTDSSQTTNSPYDFTARFNVLSTSSYAYAHSTVPVWHLSNLVQHVKIPTNYFKATNYSVRTPYKILYPAGESNAASVTTCVKIIRYPASRFIVTTNIYGTNQLWTNFVYTFEPDEIISNDVFLFTGLMTNVSGTNGQMVCVESINTNVLTGFDDWDYGYKHITNLFSQLILTHAPSNSLSWGTNGLSSKHISNGARPCGDDACEDFDETKDEGICSFDEGLNPASFPDSKWFYLTNAISIAPYYDHYCHVNEYDDIGCFGGVRAGHGWMRNTYIYDPRSIYSTNVPVYIAHDVEVYGQRHTPDISTNSMPYAELFTNQTTCNQSFYTGDVSIVVGSTDYIDQYIGTRRGFLGKSNAGTTGKVDACIIDLSGISTETYIDEVISTDWLVDEYMGDYYQLRNIYACNPNGTAGTKVMTDGSYVIPHVWKYTYFVIRNYAVTNGFKYY